MSMKSCFRLRSMSIVPLLFVAVGCARLEPLPTVAPTPPRLDVSSQVMRHTIEFDTGSSALRAAEQERLGAFLAALPRDGRLSFVVAGHADERGSLPANEDLATGRAITVESAIRRSGFMDTPVSTRSFGELAPVAPGRSASALQRNRRVDLTAEVVATRVAGCPRAGADLTSTTANHPLPGLGCATLENLARMVDDPRHLTMGQPLGPADATREAEAIVRYRTDKVKQLQDEAGVIP
jgi:pilus biogenesis lipoprotein CpaD